MGEILILVEHRKGQVRDITYEMLRKGNELCRKESHELTVLILNEKGDVFLDDLASRADRLISYEDEGLKNFNSELYTKIVYRVIQDRRPLLTLIGHTSWGMDVAPALSVKTGYPLATDVVDILLEDGSPKAVRQMYSGKVFAKVSFKPSKGYIMTLRPAAFPAEDTEPRKGEVMRKALPGDLGEARVKFHGFEDTGAGEVDISQAELLVSIGRGIGDEENIETMKELADLMGGTLSCSRPIVDKNWLPKYRQVGTSGKSVRPKVYLALGISGAFQHIAGISGAGTVIAVNKDRKAPIFRVADYGVVDDLFKVVEALRERLGK